MPAFLCQGSACSILTTQPLKAQRNQAAKGNKGVIWLAKYPLKKEKKKKKTLKATGFSHNFALEQRGNSPLQRRYYLGVQQRWYLEQALSQHF